VKLLAIDTSTEACSAALLIADEIHERRRLAPREHTQLILPMIDELMSEAGLKPGDLDAVAFGRGPGAFTGLRIAAAVIQGIAFAADLPVVPVSSLAALAQGVCRERGQGRVLAAIDARIQEVYWGAYQRDEQGLVQLHGEEVVCPPLQVQIPAGEGWYGAGSGWETYQLPLRQRLGEALSAWDGQLYPAARDVAVLAAAGYGRGEAVDAEQALPVYLRDEVAVKKN
jgi:tRNA threonylcarbamoyladenosine biosynthesis protein TsaB